jgi:hypothetical protein
MSARQTRGQVVHCRGRQGAGLEVTARRLAFARARRPMAVAMRVVAAALADGGVAGGSRRSVFTTPRKGRRAVARDASTGRPPRVPRGCEDLH